MKWLACVAVLGALTDAAAEPLPAWLHLEDLAATTSEIETIVHAPREASDTAANQGSVELLQRFAFHMEREQIVETDLRIVRFDSTDAAQQRANMRMSVHPRTEEMVVHRAFVQTASGDRVTLDPATIQTRSGTAPDVFSDALEVVFPMPAAGPGATAVLEVTRRFDLKQWPLPWSRLISLQDVDPIRRLEVRVEWTAGVEAPVVASDDPRFRCEYERDRAACAVDSIEAFELDADNSTALETMPFVVVSAPMTWHSIAAQYGALVEAQSRPSPDVQAEADRLLAGATDPEERIARLHRFVADQIRYVGLEHGTSAVVPHPAGDTLARRYGDCKDKVTLFLALARAAGIDAHPVLVSTQFTSAARAFVPTWRWFDHLIACAGDTCMDLTMPYAATGELPIGTQGQLAMDAVPAAVFPRRLASPRHAFEIDVDALREIDCDGVIKERFTRTYRGAWATLLRGLLLALPEDKRQTWLDQELRDVEPLEGRREFQIENLDAPTKPLRIASTVIFDRRSKLVDGPFIDLDAWLAHYAASLKTQNRFHPYRQRGLQYTSSIVYHVCAAFSPTDLGAELDFAARFGSLTRHYSQSLEGVRVVTRLDLPEALIADAERENWNRFLDRTIGQSRIWFAIARPPDASR